MMLTVVQEKGGAGKTTVVISFARVAARDQPVAVIDLDPQRSALALLKGSQIQVETGFGPSLPDLVFVDTPRQDAVLMARVVASADFVIVPIRANLIDLEATKNTIALLTRAKKRVFWLPNLLHARRAADQQIRDTLGQANQDFGLEWPILPGLADLAGQADFVGGRPGGAYQDQVEACWKALKKEIRRAKKTE